MQLAEPPEPESDPELEALTSVRRFRAMGLLELGFTIEQTLDMVARADVVHEANRLLERGCPHELVHNELT